MTIAQYFNEKFVIYKLNDLTGYKKQYYSTGTVWGQKQRVDDKTTIDAYGVFGATHKAWVDITTQIKEGYQLEDTEGNKYSVLSVIEEGRDIAINEHKELILKIFRPETNPK